MEIFLASFASQDYQTMSSSLIEMGATGTDIDDRAFAKDLEKIFSSIQVCLYFHLSNTIKNSESLCPYSSMFLKFFWIL